MAWELGRRSQKKGVNISRKSISRYKLSACMETLNIDIADQRILRQCTIVKYSNRKRMNFFLIIRQTAFFREQNCDGLNFRLIADPWPGPVLWVRANNADIILSISTGARVLTKVQLPQSLIPSHRPAFDQFWSSEVSVTVLSECDGCDGPIV